MDNKRETLQERLEKIDAYTYRNEWISKIDSYEGY